MTSDSRFKAVIVDDEPDAIEVLKGLIEEYCTEIAVIGTALSATDGLKLITEHSPDILFLDIQMPGNSGFDLLKNLLTQSFRIVFVSAHADHAVEAFKYHAMAYLLKPVSALELREAVSRVTADIVLDKKQDYTSMLTVLENQLTKRVAIPTGLGSRYFKPDEIIRIEAAKSYSNIFTVESEKPILVSRNLKQFQDLLSSYPFIRVHNGHLVNGNHIREYMRQDGGTLILSDGFSILVGRSYRKAITDFLDDHIESI